MSLCGNSTVAAAESHALLSFPLFLCLELFVFFNVCQLLRHFPTFYKVDALSVFDLESQT